MRVNCVLSDDSEVERVKGVLDWSLSQDVEMRILDDLLKKSESAKAINQLILGYSAKLIDTIYTAGTSSSRRVYKLPSGEEFIVKHIEQVYLSGLCQSCIHFDSGTCNEGFYNIRLQKDKKTGKFIVVLCIQNQNTKSVLPLEDFLSLYHKKTYEIPTISRGVGSIQAKRIIPIRSI